MNYLDKRSGPLWHVHWIHCGPSRRSKFTLHKLEGQSIAKLHFHCPQYGPWVVFEGLRNSRSQLLIHMWDYLKSAQFRVYLVSPLVNSMYAFRERERERIYEHTSHPSHIQTWSPIKSSPIHLSDLKCTNWGHGLSCICVWLGPAPPMPPSLTNLPTHTTPPSRSTLLTHTCVGTLPRWEPMWQYMVA